MIKSVLILNSLKYISFILIGSAIYIIIIRSIKFVLNLWNSVKTERNMMIDEKLEDFLIRQIVYQSNSATSKFVRLIGFSSLFFLTLIFTVGDIFISILLGVLGLFIPKIYFKTKESKKISVFEKQLPRALTIMSNGLKSGFNIYQSLEVVTEDLTPPISLEFEKVIREVKLGSSLTQAIDNLSKRINSKEMQFVAKTIILAMESGGKIAEILDKISTLMKEREKFNLKVKAMTTQGRMSAIVVGIMPVILFIAIFAMQPDMMKNFVMNPIGMVLMLVSVILIIVGMIVVKKIVEIKV